MRIICIFYLQHSPKIGQLQFRVLRQQVGFGLARREGLQQLFYRNTQAAHHWLASQDAGVGGNAVEEGDGVLHS